MAPNAAMGAQSFGAGAAPQAQSLTQLQTLLSRMNQRGPQGQGTPAQGGMGLGQMLMQAGQNQGPRPQLPMQRPAMGQPMAAATPPQMGGMGAPGTMNGSMGLNPSQLNMLLARQNGLMQ